MLPAARLTRWPTRYHPRHGAPSLSCAHCFSVPHRTGCCSSPSLAAAAARREPRYPRGGRRPDHRLLVLDVRLSCCSITRRRADRARRCCRSKRRARSARCGRSPMRSPRWCSTSAPARSVISSGSGGTAVIRLLGLVALPPSSPPHTVAAPSPGHCTAGHRRDDRPTGMDYVLVVVVAVGAACSDIRSCSRATARLPAPQRAADAALARDVLGASAASARAPSRGRLQSRALPRASSASRRPGSRPRAGFPDRSGASPSFAPAASRPRGRRSASTPPAPAPLTEYAWIVEHVATWPNPRLANHVAQALLPLLLAAQRDGEALEVVRARLQADPESGHSRPSTSWLAARTRHGDRSPARSLSTTRSPLPRPRPATAPAASPNSCAR